MLVRTVASAIGGMLSGPFAYAESWDEAARTYQGLAIDNAANVQVVIDNESLIVRPGYRRSAPPAAAGLYWRPKRRFAIFGWHEDTGR